MAEIAEKCFIGNLTESDCNKTWYNKNGVRSLRMMSSKDRRLVFWRALREDKVSEYDGIDSTICNHHYCQFFSFYEDRQQKCCNPFSTHITTGKIKKCKGQCPISLEIAEQYKGSLNLIPGQKLCRSCWTKLTALPSPSTLSSDFNGDSDTNLNDSLLAFGVSPLQCHGKSKRQKRLLANQKIKTYTETLESAFSSKGIIEVPCTSSVEIPDEVKNKANDFDELMLDLKYKFHETESAATKIQILTLKPKSWTINETERFFGATNYQVKKGISLKKSYGVLAEPKRNVRSGVELDFRFLR